MKFRVTIASYGLIRHTDSDTDSMIETSIRFTLG